MAEGGVGFFKTLQAMNIASRQLIDIGKEYALQFKNKEIDDKKYEELMTGKLYEVVSYAVNQVGGSDEIARFLKKHLADALIEPLKTGISLYTQAIDTAQKTMSSTQPKTIKEALDLGALESSKRLDKTKHSTYNALKASEDIKNLL